MSSDRVFCVLIGGFIAFIAAGSIWGATGFAGVALAIGIGVCLAGFLRK